VAKGEEKDGLRGEVDRLYVSACYANQGPSQKRVRPAPMGRAFRVLKRTAHLTVQVAERPEKIVAVGTPAEAPKKRARKPAASAKTSEKKTSTRKAKEKLWSNRFTRLESGSGSTTLGGRGGTRIATTRSYCTRIWSFARA